MSALPDLDAWRPTAKAWSCRCAKLALHGYATYRSDPDDGVQRFFAVVGNAVLMFPDVAALDALIVRLDAVSHNREANAT